MNETGMNERKYLQQMEQIKGNIFKEKTMICNFFKIKIY